MTPITTEPIPTAGCSDRSVGPTSKTWRYVAAFAASVALSVAVAAGVSAADDDSHSRDDRCPLFYGKPC